MATTTHYTAVLEIQRTTVSKAESHPYGKDPQATRETGEVVRLVVRADTLAALRDKLAAHVSLVDE